MNNREPGERFDRFMERCLYGPGGFYAEHGTAGRRGADFVTSPESGPLFGAVVAGVLDRWWDELGNPEPFTVYDVGCGPGTLLKSVRLARPDRPWQLIGVDRVDAPGAELDALPEDLSGAVVLANELLDNLPFRIVERGPERMHEVFVTDVPRETDLPGLREVLVPTDLTAEIPVGARAPIIDQARRWVSSVLDRGPARVCLFDYGAPTTSALAERGGWLRTYRQHARGTDPLLEPGRWDITTDVAWDQLPTPGALMNQADFLLAEGIEALVEEGRRYWAEHASAPDLTALRMRSRISEAEALLDVEGLGGWWVAIWGAAGPQPE